ncbi:MAG: NlpC/P60 family protein [Desulfatibacillaceae bacterium]
MTVSRNQVFAATAFVLASVLAIAGCASDRPAPPRPGGPGATDVEQRLRAEIANWRGTPHLLGGATKQGADCSGFVQAVYKNALGVRLPRTTATQARHGVFINVSDLAPGDLVFFRPDDKGRHVGIYFSDGEFAHVSKSRGVMISRLDDPYWRKCYWQARRVLQHRQAVAPPRAGP